MTVQKTTRIEDDRAIRATLDRIYAAWEANDAEAFVAPYAEHATAQLPGSYLANKAAIHATMVGAFTGPLRGSRAVHEVQSIRFVGGDAAIVISKGAMILAGQSESDAKNRALETWVLAREGERWLVEAFHNCPQTAP